MNDEHVTIQYCGYGVLCLSNTLYKRTGQGSGHQEQHNIGPTRPAGYCHICLTGLGLSKLLSSV